MSRTSYGGGNYDAFVAELNNTGSVLVYSTYMGGSNGDVGYGIALDSSDNAYVTGYTEGGTPPNVFPVTSGAFQTTYGGSRDAFAAKLNWSGSALSLSYSTYLGGSAQDGGYGIAVDSSGNAYVAGYTESTNFPASIQLPECKGACGTGVNYDAFVAKLKADGTALIYSTYLGGSGFDSAYGIAIDSSDNAYVTGNTQSPDFPTTPPGAFGATPPGSSEAFVAKLNWNSSAVPPLTLVYSTYLGGGADAGRGIAVDAAGDAYVTGYTASGSFPPWNPFQSNLAGVDNAFVSQLNPAGSGLLFSTYLGGSAVDAGWGIAVDPVGDIYLAGQTSSPNFPTVLEHPTVVTYHSALAGPQNAFVAKFSETLGATLAPDLNFGAWPIFTSSTPLAATLSNTGTGVLLVSNIQTSGDFSVVAGGTCGTPSPTFALAPGASCTIDVTFTPLATGTLNGLLTATDNAGTQTVNLTGLATLYTGVSISLSSVVNPTTYSAVGNTLTYTYTISNSGTVALGPTQFTITANNLFGMAPFNCGLSTQTLAVLGSFSCTSPQVPTYSVVQTDLNAGYVVNTAIATGGGATSNYATVYAFGSQGCSLGYPYGSAPSLTSVVFNESIRSGGLRAQCGRSRRHSQFVVLR